MRGTASGASGSNAGPARTRCTSPDSMHLSKLDAPPVNSVHKRKTRCTNGKLDALFNRIPLAKRSKGASMFLEVHRVIYSASMFLAPTPRMQRSPREHTGFCNETQFECDMFGNGRQRWLSPSPVAASSAALSAAPASSTAAPAPAGSLAPTTLALPDAPAYSLVSLDASVCSQASPGASARSPASPATAASANAAASAAISSSLWRGLARRARSASTTAGSAPLAAALLRASLAATISPSRSR